MGRGRTALIAILAAATVVLPGSVDAGPIGTNGRFTYQGRLKLNGALYDGPADFVVRLYDSDFGGAQLGATVTFDDLDILDGLFNFDLGFGPNLFVGDGTIVIGVSANATVTE